MIKILMFSLNGIMTFDVQSLKFPTLSPILMDVIGASLLLVKVSSMDTILGENTETVRVKR